MPIHYALLPTYLSPIGVRHVPIIALDLVFIDVLLAFS
jgi:hypothetical protein